MASRILKMCFQKSALIWNKNLKNDLQCEGRFCFDKNKKAVLRDEEPPTKKEQLTLIPVFLPNFASSNRLLRPRAFASHHEATKRQVQPLDHLEHSCV
jgi:hypothetical protein